MHDDDERHAGVRRHRFKKCLQRLDATGGSADAHDGKATSDHRPVPKKTLPDKYAFGQGGAIYLRSAVNSKKSRSRRLDKIFFCKNAVVIGPG
jgi:hypothetical protein